MKTRREFLRDGAGLSAGLLASSGRIRGDAAVNPDSASHSAPDASYARGTEVLECFDYRDVRILPGRIRGQIDDAYEVYFNLPNDDILKGFRRNAGLPAPGNDLSGWCQNDCAVTFGQWLSGMARLSCATGDQAMRDKAVALVEGWKATLGPGSDPRMGIYPWEKMVCGLVDMHLYAGYDGAMPLLERITKWAMKNLDRSRQPATSKNVQGRTRVGPRAGQSEEWYTLSENLYRAYLVNGNTLFRDFAEVWLYPTYWNKFENSTNPEGVAFLHAYSHVNTFSSAAMAYIVTGEPRYLRIVKNAYDWVQQTQAYAAGGYGPAERIVPADGTLSDTLEKRFDCAEIPCGSWAAFKMCRYLMRSTGDARYGDWVENLLYNGIGAALHIRPNGNSFYYADYRLDMAAKHYHWANWPCCSGTYIQDVADYHNLIYFRDSRGLFVNLAVPSEATWNHRGQQVSVRQSTRFPESDETKLQVSSERPVNFALRVRVPSWCSGCVFHVDAVPMSVSAKPGTWAEIDRTWLPNDVLTVKFPMSAYLAPVDSQHPRRAAVKFGPVLLAQSARGYIYPLTMKEDKLGSLLVRESEDLHFRVQDGFPAWERTSSFVPFYQVEERIPYRIYFDLDGPRRIL